MHDTERGRPPARDRVLSYLRRAWQRTPAAFRPALGVAYTGFCAVLLRELARLLSWVLGEHREFRLSAQAVLIAFVSALAAALVFGFMRAIMRPGGLTPWLLGQAVSWVFWGVTILLFHFSVRSPEPSDPSVVPALIIAGLGLVIGGLFWQTDRRKYAA